VRSSFFIAAGAALALGYVVEFLPPPFASSPPHGPASAAAVAASAVRTRVAETPPFVLVGDGPGAAPGAAPLPTVEVKPRPVHTVPDYTPPAPPVTLENGSRHDAESPRPQTATRRAPSAPRPVRTVVVSGRASLGESLSLRVRGRALPLFGVRLPPEGDRCKTRSARAPRPCRELARDELAARLSRDSAVSCRVPPGQRGHGAAAICLDAAGIDLGGLLVGEGLALADRTASYDYVGAEGVARSQHRGLWSSR
jgi:endonuclease YncB( thermonuclease family)